MVKKQALSKVAWIGMRFQEVLVVLRFCFM